MIGVAGGEMELDLEAIYIALRAAPQDRREAMPGSDGVRAPRQLRPGWAPHLPGDVRVDNAGATIQQQVIVQGHAGFDAADDDEHACQEQETIDVETVFRGSPTRHALILGHPGSGKTTALRKILFSVRDDAAAMGLTAGTVPLWLPLRRFAGLAGRGIGEWIGEELAIADRDAPLDRELGPELWRHGRLLLLADGLDEVASETKRRDLCKYLDASLLLARDARAIVLLPLACTCFVNGEQVGACDDFQQVCGHDLGVAAAGGSPYQSISDPHATGSCEERSTGEAPLAAITRAG